MKKSTLAVMGSFLMLFLGTCFAQSATTVSQKSEQIEKWLGYGKLQIGLQKGDDESTYSTLTDSEYEKAEGTTIGIDYPGVPRGPKGFRLTLALTQSTKWLLNNRPVPYADIAKLKGKPVHLIVTCTNVGNYSALKEVNVYIY